MVNNVRWSSRLNFILATTGAAVGLGSIWKFPYMVGSNGGGAFVLLTIISIMLIGIPVMMAEILLGKLSRTDPVTALKTLAITYNVSTKWSFLGWWGAFALILVLSFYSVIASWSIAYIIKTWSGSLANLSAAEISQHWDDFLNSPGTLIMWHSIFMATTIFVVGKGVKAGLEKAAKIMMPGLFIVLIILMSYSIYTGDAMQAIKFLFTPDFSKINSAVIGNAVGQAAFSLAIGAGCLLTYGGYITDKTKIGFNSCIIALLVVLVSLCSGIAIFPLVFSAGLAPEGGPGLMYQVLPIAFNKMPAGNAFGGLFFLMLWFAALSASISMAETLVMILSQQCKITRKRAACIIGSLTWSLGLLALFSFNILAEVKLFGVYNFFDLMADFATNIVLPTGALGFALFAGCYIDKKTIMHEMQISQLGFLVWKCLIRFAVPIGIVIIVLY